MQDSRQASLSNYENKVVILDLVSGLQVTTEVTEVYDCTLVCKNPIVFQVNAEPADPLLPPSHSNPMQQKLSATPYGGPFSVQKDEVTFELQHIIAIHEPIAVIEKSYLQATSGIQLAGADDIAHVNSGQRV